MINHQAYLSVCACQLHSAMLIFGQAFVEKLGYNLLSKFKAVGRRSMRLYKCAARSLWIAQHQKVNRTPLQLLSLILSWAKSHMPME